MIRKFIEKRKAKRALEKLVNPEQVEKFLREGSEPPKYRQDRIEFILTFIRGENPDEVSKRVALVTDLARVYGAIINHIVGPLVVVAFHKVPVSEARRLLVQSLQQQLGHDIKIVHGAANGHHGPFGKGLCMYTFLVPRFDEVLGKLSELEFGWVAEFP